MKEKKARVEDALHACRAAVEEGILPGGGVAVLRAPPRPSDKVKTSSTATRRPASTSSAAPSVAPIKQIAENAGLDGSHRRPEGHGERRTPTSATTP